MCSKTQTQQQKKMNSQRKEGIDGAAGAKNSFCGVPMLVPVRASPVPSVVRGSRCKILFVVYLC